MNDPADAAAAISDSDSDSYSDDPHEDCLAAKLPIQVGKGNTSSIEALLDAGASVDGCCEADHADFHHANPPLVSASTDGSISTSSICSFEEELMSRLAAAYITLSWELIPNLDGSRLEAQGRFTLLLRDMVAASKVAASCRSCAR